MSTGSHVCDHASPDDSGLGSSSEHIPLGTRDIPLLAHEHPPLKFARQHHKDASHVPHHHEPGYDHYCTARDVTLLCGIKSLEKDMWTHTPIAYLSLENTTLIVYYHSQSKLSQQELADLQKATHFDKKELQQWYKGKLCCLPLQPPIIKTTPAHCSPHRLPEGLPVGHAHQGGVPEDL